MVPLTNAESSGAAQKLSHLLWEQLHPHVDAQVLTAVTEGVWELVANALEHSGADALLMAQIYRRRRGGRPPDHDDRVQVVIGDTGRGIRSSFVATAVRIPRTDLEAINFALEYLVTSVPNDRGRGQGLSTTMELVTEMQGKMVVRSGNAKVAIHPGERSEATVPALAGVIVALSLPLYPGG